MAKRKAKQKPAPTPPSIPDRIAYLAQRTLRQDFGDPATKLMHLIQECLRDEENSDIDEALCKAGQAEFELIEMVTETASTNYFPQDPDSGQQARVALFAIPVNLRIEAEQDQLVPNRFPEAAIQHLAQRLSELNGDEIILSPERVQPRYDEDWGPHTLFRMTRALTPARLRENGLDGASPFPQQDAPHVQRAGTASEIPSLLFGVQVLQNGGSLLEREELEAPVHEVLDELSPELAQSIGVTSIEMGMPTAAPKMVRWMMHLPVAIYIVSRVIQAVSEQEQPPEQLVVGLESFPYFDDTEEEWEGFIDGLDAAEEMDVEPDEEAAGAAPSADGDVDADDSLFGIGVMVKRKDRPELPIYDEDFSVPFNLDEDIIMDMAKSMLEQLGVSGVFLLDDPGFHATATSELLELFERDWVQIGA